MSDIRTAKLCALTHALAGEVDAHGLCQQFGVDRSTVKRWIARGMPCDRSGKGKRNRFNESEVAAWLEANHLTGRVGRPDVAVAVATATSAQVCRAFHIGRRQLSRWMHRGLPFLLWRPGRASSKRFCIVAVFRWLER
ncbi:MAG: Phage packaging protein Nu1, partial [Phycisphaerales bacterium]|nr:Phage packaging protein Nu1 [Phycisphaerales bacterium]